MQQIKHQNNYYDLFFTKPFFSNMCHINSHINIILEEKQIIWKTAFFDVTYHLTNAVKQNKNLSTSIQTFSLGFILAQKWLSTKKNFLNLDLKRTRSNINKC